MTVLTGKASHCIRAVTALATLLAACIAAQASSIILRSSSATPPELSPITTYAGTVEATVSAIRPAPSLTIVLLLDTINGSTLEGLKADLLSHFGSLRGRNLRLVTVQNNEVQVAGPLLSGAALQGVLKEVQPNAAGSAPISTSVILDLLANSAAQFGSKWSRVLMIGDLPPIDPPTVQYASALLLRTFSAQQVQVSWLPLSPTNDEWLPLFESSGGTIVRGALSSGFTAPGEAGNRPFVVEWTPAQPASGFVVLQPSLTDRQGNVLLEAPDLAVHENASLPSIARFSALESQLTGVATLFNQPQLTEADTQRIKTTLLDAFGVNPLNPVALGAAIAFHEKLNDSESVAKYARILISVHPQDGTAYAALGHALFRSNNPDEAEAALQHAATLQIRTASVAEDLARIHLARKDDIGALPYLAEALRLDVKRQQLWFEQARAAERLRNPALATQSFEQGLALGGDHVPETTSLLRLYLASKQDAKALSLASRVMTGLPPDPSLRSEFAAGLDELKQSDQALLAWRRVLEVQPASEPAHYRISRLLLESGDVIGAEKAASAGIGVVPSSARLYVVKAEALQKQGHRYGARASLEQGMSAAPSPDLLSHLALVEDTYSGSAADAYTRLADSLSPSSEERLQALERGFIVSVRDDDLKHAALFASLLQSAGHAEFGQLLGAQARPESGTMIPGGLSALAFAAHSDKQIPPGRFFVEYSQALINAKEAESPDHKSPVFEEIEKHFKSVSALETMGARNGACEVIDLSLAGKKQRRNTEKTLDILGIKMHLAKGEVEINRGQKQSQAKKAETASALAIDEVGIQEALAAGQPYELKICDEWAQVYPDEKLWRDALYPTLNEAGGLALALLRMPKMAELYVGMSSLDRKVITELLNSVSLQTLYEKYSRLLYLFGPAFAMQGDHAVVPGGNAAEPIWAQLVGASPSKPAAFFSTLLDRDNGKLLAYFFVLSGLDLPHQAFFTASASRTTKFYKLFASSDELQHLSPHSIHESPLSALLRSVPLDREGHLHFSGSPEVWTLASGRASSETHVAELLNKVGKVAPPEIEDELLERLAQTRYVGGDASRHTEIENFLAVSHIEAHRTHPLDAESALILAQHYSDYGGTYPYFEDVTALGATEFADFFSAIDHITKHPTVAANLELGELNSLIEWICLMTRRQVLREDDAVKIFRSISERFTSANDDAAYAAASLDSARAILGSCHHGRDPLSADDEIRSCLLGANGGQASDLMAKQFQSVLDLQKTPHLDPLLSLYEATNKLSEDPSRTHEISTIAQVLAGLPSVDLPKQMAVKGKEKDALTDYDLTLARKLVGELNQKASKRKVNPEAISKLSRELLKGIQPLIGAALAGPVYAYFLRPTDLAVSEDPLLLRKHRYFDFVSASVGAVHPPKVVAAEFFPESQGAGSYFLGGFAQFGLAAGVAAGVGWKTASHAASDAVAAQISAIRGSTWDRLEEDDLRLLGLRITVAREWIVESARRPDAFRALTDETAGLLSLSRRADLLNSIEGRNWQKAWDSITLPDLFALGGRYLDHFAIDPWPSPVTVELRAVSHTDDGSRLNILGSIPYHAFGCSHPHLLAAAPYEEYEQHYFPTEIAERSAEFKLFLAFQADRVGVEPGELTRIAEPLAAKAFRSAEMTDSHDWRSLLAAFATITADDLKQALEQ